MQMHITQMIGGRNIKLCRPNTKRLIFTLKEEKNRGAHGVWSEGQSIPHFWVNTLHLH